MLQQQCPDYIRMLWHFRAFDLSHISGHCWQQSMQAWSKTNCSIRQSAVNK